MSEHPHIFRWDLDKTYLATEFDSVADLVRTALQRPADKANVPGSAELLQSLRADSGGRAQGFFFRGSPRPMRGVVAEKGPPGSVASVAIESAPTTSTRARPCGSALPVRSP